jgi:hypothetical protein
MKRRALLALCLLSLLGCEPTTHRDVLPTLPDAGSPPDAAPMCGLPAPAPASCSGQPDGEPCDDGDVCTHGDACLGGVCRGDTPGRLCVRCASDADCCGVAVACDGALQMWAPSGRCLPSGSCAMERYVCRLGATCETGKDCR